MNDLLQQIQNFAGDFTHVEPVYYRNGNIVRRSRSGQETIIPLGGTFVETDPTVPGHVKAITTTQVNNWNTAYSWGNHATAGYLTSIPTLAQVTTAGNTTTNSITVGGLIVDTDTLYVDSVNNRVGIGTTTPNAPLGINGTGGDNTPMVRYSGSSSVTFNWLTSGLHPNLTAGQNSLHIFGKANSTYNSAWVGYLHSADGSSNNALSFGMYGANNLMNLTGAGNLGIGTTSPVSKLDVNGTVSLSGLSFAFGAPGANPINVITRPDGQHAMYIISGSDAHTAYQNLEHRFRDMNGNTRLAIRSNGNVVIGSYTDEGFKFQVNGTTKITGSVTLSNLPTGIVKSTNGALSSVTNGLTGTITIQQPSGNPPINIDVVDGLIVNVSGAMIMV
jgi:hypothetical protein